MVKEKSIVKFTTYEDWVFLTENFDNGPYHIDSYEDNFRMSYPTLDLAIEIRDDGLYSWDKLDYFTYNEKFKNHTFYNVKDLIKSKIIEIW